jgi:hypothetical protein
MTAEMSSAQHVDLFEMILVERNIEDMTIWARVVALPCLVMASFFVLAAWLELFSGSVASTLPGCFGAMLLFISLYIPRLVMVAFQAIHNKVGKRPLQWSLRIMWSVVGTSLLTAMVSGVWSVNYPGVLLPLVFGLSPGQSIESFREDNKHNSSILLQLLTFPLGNHRTILNIFGVFAACLPHLFITSLSLPPIMAISITLIFLIYCCVCAICSVRQSFPSLVQFIPHIIYMFMVAAFVHVGNVIANVQLLQWTLSPLPIRVVTTLLKFLSTPFNRYLLRIAIALVSCAVFWALGCKCIRFFVDSVFIIGYTSMIFKYVSKTQGFLIRPSDSSQAKSPPTRTGGYSLRRPHVSNVLTLLSSIAMSLPLQFLPLDWLPFGRHILKALGDESPPAEGLKLFVFVIWSVLNPMLLLRDLRLSMSTLLFIYGGNLVYVDISILYALRNIEDSTSHPPFVLIDVVFEFMTVSICMLLLLTVSHLTMQVDDLSARV